jgi:hypothetical protein
LQILKNNSRVDINIADYDVTHYFDQFWRVRLNMIRVILLDEFDKPIPSPGIEVGQYIGIRITYPTLFVDANLNKDKFSFLAQDFLCAADYFTQGEGKFKKCCQSLKYKVTKFKRQPSDKNQSNFKVETEDISSY